MAQRPFAFVPIKLAKHASESKSGQQSHAKSPAESMRAAVRKSPIIAYSEIAEVGKILLKSLTVQR
jgi:hypothetical protein